jgi:putative transposase
MRHPQLREGYIYHIFTKSIAGYKVFRDPSDYKRFIETVRFYQYSTPPAKFSVYLRLKNKDKFFKAYLEDRPRLVDILAYCVMPTHVHLLLTQINKDGISNFMKCVLDSYTRYFNTRTQRKGPLWQSRFKSVVVEKEEQFMHLTRYIHLNPTTDQLVKCPEDWEFSSYREYLGKGKERLCNFEQYYEIPSAQYRQFVENQIDYQKTLKITTSDVVKKSHVGSGNKEI